jgi:hypothetical protein
MREAHPFLTEELGELRLKQRRLLRSIPDWVLDADHLGPAEWKPESVPEGDRALVEMLVRDMIAADPGWSGIEPLLKEWARDTSSSRLAHFVLHEASESPGHNLVSSREVLVKVTNDRAQEATTATTKTIPTELVPAVGSLILMLVWADVLAGDYTDPRLERRWASEAAASSS